MSYSLIILQLLYSRFFSTLSTYFVILYFITKVCVVKNAFNSTKVVQVCNCLINSELLVNIVSKPLFRKQIS